MTKSSVAGVDLVKQLASCSEYMYPNSRSVVVSLKANVDCVTSSCAYATANISTTIAVDQVTSDSHSTVYCNACEGNDGISEGINAATVADYHYVRNTLRSIQRLALALDIT